MRYEINVARMEKCSDGQERYVHLFATHERSLKNGDKAKEVLELFRQKFPKHEGYDVSIKRIKEIGEILEW